MERATGQGIVEKSVGGMVFRRSGLVGLLSKCKFAEA
jgi:hypothetical protein